MKNLKYIIGLFSVASIFLMSCEKEFDAPELKVVPTGNVVSIADLRAMHVPGTTVEINEDLSVFGIITADESTGNLYKESYIEDATGGINLRFISSTGLYIGDSVRVYLKGSKLLRYNQMMQVDSLHPDNSIVKIGTLQNRVPQVVTISEINNDLEGFQGELIQINNVYFIEGGQGKMYADAANLESVSRSLSDGTELIDVRTSGYANFASDTLASGYGTFIGIMTQYKVGSTNIAQLLIRNPNELNMNGDAPLVKDFNDQSLTSGGWTTQHLAGPSYTAWGIFAATNSAAKITCYNSATAMGEVSESWLISPAIDLSNSATPNFNFRNVVRYGTTPQLQVMVSTNYDGTSNPNTATWTDLTSLATWDTDISSWNTWTSSGDLNLTPYISSATYVAFKHVGVNTSGVGTWEIDDITIIK
ncbi:DUF5689 domain-containing protein [Vicingus serpentipes]|nr:DUF5689 domain-containing protein [Vicingus serpentipes]